MDYLIREVTDSDRKPVIDIFNYFIDNSMATYREKRVDDDFFDFFKDNAINDIFYVIEYKTDIVGFGLIRTHRKADTFNRTCELTYFILPDYTRLGIGTKLLEILIDKAKQNGIDNLLASISSYNERSLKFHEKHGFNQCGRFRRVAKKFGKDFDIIWMQRFL